MNRLTKALSTAILPVAILSGTLLGSVSTTPAAAVPEAASVPIPIVGIWSGPEPVSEFQTVWGPAFFITNGTAITMYMFAANNSDSTWIHRCLGLGGNPNYADGRVPACYDLTWFLFS